MPILKAGIELRIKFGVDQGEYRLTLLGSDVSLFVH